jgi:hypothetical protein
MQEAASGLTDACAITLHLPCICIALSTRSQTIVAIVAPKSQVGLGDNTMRQKLVAGATMIVAAGLIGMTQERLPRPIRDYRDRVSVEMSEVAVLDIMVDWHRLAELHCERVPKSCLH